jgi:hypothetical protein
MRRLSVSRSLFLQLVITVGIWEKDAHYVLAFSPSKLHRAVVVLIDTTSSVLGSRNHLFRDNFLGDSRFNYDDRRSSSLSPRTVLDAHATVLEDEEITTANATTTMEGVETIVVNDFASPNKMTLPGTIELAQQQDELMQQIEAQAVQIVDDMMDESCEVDPDTGAPADDICVNEEKKSGFRSTVKDYIQRTSKLVVERGLLADADDDEFDNDMENAASEERQKKKKAMTGDALEKGCKCFISLIGTM